MSTQSNTATPPVTRGQTFTLSALADTFMACYQGRDPSFTSRLSFFTQHLGEKVACEIDADDIDDVLEALNGVALSFQRIKRLRTRLSIAIDAPSNPFSHGQENVD